MGLFDSPEERKKEQTTKKCTCSEFKIEKKKQGRFLYNSTIGTLVKKIYMLQD